jgi:hypothetical protein
MCMSWRCGFAEVRLRMLNVDKMRPKRKKGGARDIGLNPFDRTENEVNFSEMS